MIAQKSFFKKVLIYLIILMLPTVAMAASDTILVENDSQIFEKHRYYPTTSTDGGGEVTRYGDMYILLEEGGRYELMVNTLVLPKVYSQEEISKALEKDALPEDKINFISLDRLKLPMKGKLVSRILSNGKMVVTQIHVLNYDQGANDEWSFDEEE